MLLLLIVACELAQVGETQQAPSAISARVEHGWLRIIGLDPNGPTPTIEVDAPLEAFGGAEQRGADYLYKLPAYRGSALLPVAVSGKVYRGTFLAGTFSFEYPRKRYEIELVGLTAGFTHKEAN
jgi:hypothetical protein